MNIVAINKIILFSVIFISWNSFSEEGLDTFDDLHYFIKDIDLNKDGRLDRVVASRPEYGNDIFFYIKKSDGYELVLKGDGFSEDGGNRLIDISPLNDGSDVLRIITSSTYSQVDYIVSYINHSFMLDKTIIKYTYPMDMDNRNDFCIVQQNLNLSEVIHNKIPLKMGPDEVYRDQKCELKFNVSVGLDQMIDRIKTDAINSFNTTQRYAAFIDKYPITVETLRQYNDIGFYLQQRGSNQESIFLLKKIIDIFPNRTVSYINLGDSYWDFNDKNNAKNAYKHYILLMKKAGKESKVPPRIFERLN